MPYQVNDQGLDMYQQHDQEALYQMGNGYDPNGYEQGYDVYPGDIDMLQYREQFYEENEQAVAHMQPMNNHQYGDAYYDPLNDMPPDQYAADDPRYGDFDYAADHLGADVAAGIPRAQDDKQDGPAEDQFTRLLNSLEARVDLMAQMQHTRAEIQKHTRNLQGNTASSRNAPLALPGIEPRTTPVLELEPERPFSKMEFSMVGSNHGDFRGGNIVEETALVGLTGNSLACENAMLRDEFEDQRGAIERLTCEVAGMRDTLRTMSVDQMQRSMNTTGMAGLAHGFESEDALRNTHADQEVITLQSALQEERRRNEQSSHQWGQERQRLLEELNTLKTGTLGRLPVVGEEREALMATESINNGFSAGLSTSPVLPAGGRRGVVAPLCQTPCGLNIELSESGYLAKRIRGCRQSVVIGSAPLEPQDLGRYYEVIVRETVNGWVGGLGIGVTRVSPAELKRMPDKAWRIPNTFIVGYWGCLFLDGREKRTRWKADTLKAGSRVGLLVTGDGRGDLIVFVDGEPVVRADDVLPSIGGDQVPLYPVIDVFAATLAVEVKPTAYAPAKPWGKDPSPPGSPLLWHEASTAQGKLELWT
jgi:hypothetical protein